MMDQAVDLQRFKIIGDGEEEWRARKDSNL